MKKMNANISSGGFNPSGGLTVVGNNDPHVSPYLKAWVAQGSTCVCGVIGEGTSKEITSNWDTPFEAESTASQFRKTEGALQFVTQVATGSARSLKTAAETYQKWTGNEPTRFNLVLEFYALSDAKREVMDAIQALETMASPTLGLMGVGPGGEVPGFVTLNIGRNVMIQDCLIKNIIVPLDGPRTKEGYLARAQVTLQIETERMLGQADVKASYQ